MPYSSIFAPQLFKGRSAIVTGGGSGLGRCMAHELSALGASVALVGRTVAKLEKVRDEIVAQGGTATVHGCDIRVEDEVKGAIDAILAAHGRIDGLVNNAGGQYLSPIRDLSTKGWEAVVRNNLTGGFIFARETYLRWMEQNGGAIVNIIADIWGGWPGAAHSGAARGGMLTFTESAACEWAHSGVRVNAVAPGYIESSGLDTYPPEHQEMFTHWHKGVPMQRFGTASEVSAAVVFLLSPGAAYITGTCVRVDGGTPNARPNWKLPAHDKSVRFDGFKGAAAAPAKP